MFAVIRSGGKQYRVCVGDILTLERLEAEAGQSVELSEVLLLGGADTAVGAPIVEGAQVRASVMEHIRGPKLLSVQAPSAQGVVEAVEGPSAGTYARENPRDLPRW